MDVTSMRPTSSLDLTEEDPYWEPVARHPNHMVNPVKTTMGADLNTGYTHVYTHTYTHIYTHIHAYMHIDIHIYNNNIIQFLCG